MRLRARVLTVLALTTVAIPFVVAPASGEPAADHVGAPPPRTITLITGDRVTVTEQPGQKPAITVAPAAGREGMTFARTQDANGWSVIPRDALPLLAKGKLDRQLFQVDKLLAAGYDDKQPTVPLIVQYGDGPRAANALPGVDDVKALPSAAATAMHERKDTAANFWSALTGGPNALTAGTAVRKVWLDRKIRASLDHSVPQIGAPEAWQHGLTGKDVTVAVLDTGIDATHPDLAGKIVSAQNFSTSADTTDRQGHGTHVASTIVGTGAASGGKYRGVAPDAKLFVGKVLGDDGSGALSDVIRGMEWAADKGAKVVSMSLGGDKGPDVDPGEEAVNRLTADKGVLFVIAAGNSGPGPESIESPGSAEAALTVGAVDRNDKLADFSSRGPSSSGLKPEITAPGVDIVAARAAGTDGPKPVDAHYTTMSGTSMATPHVAGAAAILVQQHPDWKADRLKATLAGSAKPAAGSSIYQQGAGRVDVARATTQTVTPSVATLPFGEIAPGTTPLPRQLTYQNTGTTPVDLDLRLDVADDAGKAAPAGMFAASTSKLTVPAGGTASATVTVDPKRGPTGIYGGRLVATTSTGVAVQTPVGATLPREKFDVTVKMFNRLGNGTGDPTPPGAILMATNLDTTEGTKFYCVADGSGTLKLDRGRYLFVSVGTELLGNCNFKGRADNSIVVQPGFEVNGNRELLLDGRKAHRVTVATSHADARSTGQVLGVFEKMAGGGTASYESYEPRVFNDDTIDSFVAPTQGPPVADFHFVTTTMLARQTAKGSPENSPYVYNLQFPSEGRIPDVGAYQVHERDLAEVRATYASSGDKQWGNTQILPASYGSDAGSAWFLTAHATLPATRTEYYSTSGVRWLKQLLVDKIPTNGGWAENREGVNQVAYQPGKKYTERWNQGVFGSRLAAGQTVTDRVGDQLHVLYPVLVPNTSDHNSGSYVEGTTRLLLDGKEIGSLPGVPTPQYPDGTPPTFTVPSAPGTYTLSVDGHRTEDSSVNLTSKISTKWTFRSQHTDAKTALPLMVLRPLPELDEFNSAPTWRPMVMPVEVERVPGAKNAAVRELTAEASFDDGVTWQQVPAWRNPIDGKWQALVLPPFWQAPKFTSLRLSATDTDGNSVSQTLIHAYRLR